MTEASSAALEAAFERASDRPRVTLERAAAISLECAADGSRILHFVGAYGSGAALFGRGLLERGKRLVYVVAGTDAARRTEADLEAMCRGLVPALGAPRELQRVTLIAPETTPFAEVHPDRRLEIERASSLTELARPEAWQVLVLTAAALVRKVAPRELLLDSRVELRFGESVDLTACARQLSELGYLRTPLVEDPATFAVRGGILDVWPAGSDSAFRVEFDGDLVSSIRSLDTETQRAQGDRESLVLSPARQAILHAANVERARTSVRALCDAINLPSSRARSLAEDVSEGRLFLGADAFLPAFIPLVSPLAYVPDDALLVVVEPVDVRKALEQEWQAAHERQARRADTPHFGVNELYLERDVLDTELTRRSIVCLSRTGVAGAATSSSLDALESTPLDAPTLGFEDHSELRRALGETNKQAKQKLTLEPLFREIEAWKEAGLEVVISARSSTQADRLQSLLSHRGLVQAATDGVSPDPSQRARVSVVVSPLARGVIAVHDGFVLLTEEEIFGTRAHREKERPRTTRQSLEDLRALAPGDYLVHVEHGIGRYLGLEHKKLGDVRVDLLVVEYAAGDKLFLPVHRLNQIHKYSGGEGSPKLDRLGGLTFAKTKARVQRRVRQLADELLKLYAERNAVKKDPLPPVDDDYRAFEAGFPFEETRDQATAIQDVLKDLGSERVMDRLVCGDVGFGKTEVAIRAAFRNVAAGRQVALLCPTTVLAQQHFQTLSTRLADHPFNVRVMSRFQSQENQEETLRGLKAGSVDLVVGTHRLLSKDVHFKNLGLLVVDEEQRFGVVHKERIKQLRASVDVLTLSATPIPRTLQMAVGGFRDLSLISTAPVDRRAIRTVVSRIDDALIREAVERELDRNGQVFYVHNRVAGLGERAERLQALIPRARITLGHGQMKEASLERAMLDFVGGKYDVLVSTAIIESGLDIARANTIIIDRADLFGLSELYQLRGRVGRSSERAYCYLLVPPPSELSEEARLRIEALERHSALGSGFQIATLDLELRGAGDVLGAEQSGFVASVGFDLFCDMLTEATQELRGEPVVHEIDPELSFDIEALLPEDYVSEVGLRLSFYKRLSVASTEAEVDAIGEELGDRFGEPPPEARQLLLMMRLKTELRRLRVLGCEANQKSVTLHLKDDTPLDPAKVGALIAAKASVFRLSPDGKLVRRATASEAFPHGLAHADKALDELSSCVKDG
jgi:transcription-repair coupling factor (superfamily II helicase)